MDEATSEARRLIEQSDHMTVATADASGKPWSTPVFYAQDEAYNLYWVSSKSALHSANIRARAEVAITIYRLGDTTEGVYVDAEALELGDEEEIRRATVLLNQKDQSAKFRVQGVEDVTGDAAWRIYKAIPRAVYRRADSTENGQAVTVREALNLP